MTAWRKHHDQDLHSIRTISREIEKHFTIQETRKAPYLYRYLTPVVEESVAATDFIERILSEEMQLGRPEKDLAKEIFQNAGAEAISTPPMSKTTVAA